LLAAPYDVLLNGRKLQLPGTSLSSFSLKGDGSANQHQLQAAAKSPKYGSLELALKGSYGTGEWTGSLQQASVKFKNVPRWWLVSGKPIHISARDISVADQCFTTTTNLTSTVERNPVSPQSQAEWNPNQSPVNNANNWLLTSSTPSASPVAKTPPPRLCIQGNWMPESGMQLNALLDAVPLRQFYALFKPEVFFAGVMDGSLKVSSKSFRLEDINARFGLTTRNAELRYQFSGGITEVYPWNNTGVEATLEKGQLKAAARMQWVGYGYLEANSQLNLLTQEINSGSLVARFDNLAPLETLIRVANDVSGDLRVDLNAGGTVKKPEISGDISIKDGSANLPKLGLDLKQIQMNLVADKSEQISLSGQMQSGEGQINLEAQLNQLGSPDWQATGSLQGSNFKVINVPQLKINLNPDVQLEANAQTLRFSGEAMIPWARAVIKTLPPSTTRVSSDVVIEDEQHVQAATEGGVEVYTNIKLTLGDDVTFKGFGLDSQLSGVMQLFKDAQRKQLLTNGFVAVKKGTYKAYGQNLTIERGRLIFQGPYENPGLDIRASRKIDDEDETQVGLEISGTLQRPIARVYSLPSQHSESEAMMMLLTGKPVSEESRAEATLLMGAISGLGNDSDSISTGITQFFRVDELAINSEKGIEQSELWIGKQLTPQLMVRYVVGLFDQMVSLGMEYQLSDHLRIEAESGEIQSVDVIYRIER
jgi:translocation and assembly module TamB